MRFRHLKNDVTGALSDYDQAVKIDPKFARAYLNRGIAKLEQGNRSEAEKDFVTCVKLRPELKNSVTQILQLEKSK